MQGDMLCLICRQLYNLSCRCFLLDLRAHKASNGKDGRTSWRRASRFYMKTLFGEPLTQMEAPTVFRSVAANVERPAVGDSSDHRVERQKTLPFCPSLLPTLAVSSYLHFVNSGEVYFII